MSSAKGASRERELVNRFDAAGWGALRLPASGSATERELPDVLAGTERVISHDRAGNFYYPELLAVELKSGKATTLYVTGKEVGDLLAFAEQWGAQAFLGARFTTQGSSTATYLVTPERARGPTDGGAYGLPVADIEQRAAVVVSDEGVERRD